MSDDNKKSSSLVNISASDLLGLGKAGSRLVEVLEKAFGALYRPTGIWREGRAAVDVEAYRIETLANAKSAAASTDDNKLLEIGERTERRMLAEQMYQQENLEQILGLVRDEIRAFNTNNLADDSNASDEIDLDWFFRFLDKAKYVSNESLQQIWAKILSGEAHRPGSFSSRTLNILSDLGPGDAANFEKLCGLSTNVGGIYKPMADRGEKFNLTFEIENWEHQFELNHSILVELESLGLLLSPSGVTMKNKITQGKHGMRLSYNGANVVVKFEGEQNFPYMMLSSSGNELARLLQIPVNLRYLEILSKSFQDCGIPATIENTG